MNTYRLPSAVNIVGYNFDAVTVKDINWETMDDCSGYQSWIDLDTPDDVLFAEAVGFDSELKVIVDGGYKNGKTLLKINPFN